MTDSGHEGPPEELSDETKERLSTPIKQGDKEIEGVDFRALGKPIDPNEKADRTVEAILRAFDRRIEKYRNEVGAPQFIYDSMGIFTFYPNGKRSVPILGEKIDLVTADCQIIKGGKPVVEKMVQLGKIDFVQDTKIFETDDRLGLDGDFLDVNNNKDLIMGDYLPPQRVRKGDSRPIPQEHVGIWVPISRLPEGKLKQAFANMPPKPVAPQRAA